MTRANRDKEFQAVWDAARAAGLAAGASVNPNPMVVEDKQSGAQWFVSEGVCGFAWITVHPANCPFSNWLKKNRLGKTSYSGGVTIWISDFNQSMARKEQCAFAMAKMFKEKLGVNCYANSRMD